MEVDLPILQLGTLNVDLRRYSYVPADFSSYFPPSSAQDWMYEWQDESEGETFKEPGIRFQCPLWVVIERLNLMGLSEALGRQVYEDLASASEERSSKSQIRMPSKPPFDALAAGIAAMDLSDIRSGHPTRGAQSPWHVAASHAAYDLVVPASGVLSLDPVEWCRQEIEYLDTATMLQLLARNPNNVSRPVTWWAYHEVIYGDRDEEDYANDIGAKPEDQVMIVTEGKSDTRVIEKALSIYSPHIQDFFTFVDMTENYPFTGVGNLTNFYMGLRKIGILNNVLIIFDNDAEGSAKFDAAANLPPLPNIKIMKLPAMQSLSRFHTVGPTGEHFADINGRASSIECFLDFSWKASRMPSVRWTSYLKSSGEYQGELIDKASYLRSFLALTDSEAKVYDSTKLAELIEGISREAGAIAWERVMKEYWGPHHPNPPPASAS